jgi:hypothetical protein
MKTKREKNKSGSKEITPADRVRALRAKQGQEKSGHEVSTSPGTFGPVHAKYGTCDYCGQPLEGDSPILGIVHCPICDGPFSRRVLMRWLMAAFWGALFPLGLGFFAYFFWLTPMQNGETILLRICLVMWLLMTLIVALQKILPENIGFHGGGDFGGGNGGG